MDLQRAKNEANEAKQDAEKAIESRQMVERDLVEVCSYLERPRLQVSTLIVSSIVTK